VSGSNVSLFGAAARIVELHNAMAPRANTDLRIEKQVTTGLLEAVGGQNEWLGIAGVFVTIGIATSSPYTWLDKW
jgi:hypothetical protein